MMVDAAQIRDPFARAYSSLRGELARAARPPGSQIRVDRTARELSISSTPVREALAMLAGERLVLGCKRQGYFVPKPSAGELIQLYTISEMYLLTAVRVQSAKRQPGVSGPFADAASIDTVSGVARVFIAILARAEMQCLLDLGALMIERLAPARLVEDANPVDQERDELVALAGSGRFTALAKAIRTYHRLRRANAGEVAKALAAAAAPDRYIPDMV